MTSRLFCFVIIVLVCVINASIDDRRGRILRRHKRNNGKPMRSYQHRYWYKMPTDQVVSKEEMKDLFESLTPNNQLPPGSSVMRSYRVQMPPTQMIEDQSQQPEDERIETIPTESPLALLRRLMKQTSGRLSPVVEASSGECGWNGVGTRAATSLIDDVIDSRGDDLALQHVSTRQESISTRCSAPSAQSQTSCSTHHKVRLTFTLMTSSDECGECECRSKCACAARQSDLVKCEASGEVNNDFTISQLQFTCDDDDVGSG